MEFNVEELMKQRKEEILKSGKYVRCEIVVGCDDDIPYMNLEATGVGIKQILRLLAGIKTIKDSLFDKYPSLKFIDKVVEESDIKSAVYDVLKDEEGGDEDEETV